MAADRETVAGEPFPEATELAPTRRRLVVSLILTAVATALLVFLVATRGDDILEAARSISVGRFVAITSLSLVALALRSASWRVAIASHTRVSLPFAWNVTTMTALYGYVNIYFGFAARVAFARRFGPRSLTIANLGVAELAMIAIESVIALALVAVFATRVGVPAWVAAAALAAAVGLLVAAHRYRGTRFPVLRESAFADSRSLVTIGLLMAATLLVQVLRVSLALEAVGLPHSLFTSTIAFLAMGILATLPIGPSSFPAAMALVFAGESLDAALAAGLAVLSASLLAALLAAPPALYQFWRGSRAQA